MKHLSLISAVTFAALVLIGCNKETTQGTDPDSGTKAITVTINGAALTKATFEGDAPYEAEKHEFSKIHLYFTDANQRIVVSREVTSSDGDEWTELTGNGVRYTGLEGVSQVYVIANPSGVILASGKNLNELTFNLENLGAKEDQTSIPYFGGDADITPLKDEINGNVNVTIDPSTGNSAEPEVGEQYYTAEVSIRPIVSRLEIGKITVESSGKFEIDGDEIGLDDANGKKFQVEWNGFQPVLGGIYMSNVNTMWKPVPANTGATDLFETPTGQTGIQNGAWNADLPNVNEINQSGIALYSNYNEGTSSYDQLFDTPTGDVYFDGTTSNVCVPFNFIVDYDILATVGDIAALGDAQPKFHFQFQYKNSEDYTYRVYDITNGEEQKQEITNENNPILYQALVVDFALEVTEDNLYYANVTLTADGTTDYKVKPAKIYKMNTDFTIRPYNITTGTVDPGNKHNVIVNVTVIDFDDIEVTPIFDKN